MYVSTKHALGSMHHWGVTAPAPSASVNGDRSGILVLVHFRVKIVYRWFSKIA